MVKLLHRELVEMVPTCCKLQPYLASLHPRVPVVQATKSLRKERSLLCQQNGKLPSKAWLIVGGRDRAKPLPSNCECAVNTCKSDNPSLYT